MRRLAPALLAALTLAGPAAAATPDASNWSERQQEAVAEAGVMSDAGGFRGEQALSPGAFREAIAALAARYNIVPVKVPSGPVTVERFHKVLVAQLGLSDLAAAVQSQAAHAGLAPPKRFGAEVVARQLELRFNHPEGQEQLEQFPWDRITRAEAAWSFSKLIDEDTRWRLQNARNVLGQFALERPAAKQRRALKLAVSKIGMPYIWGGEADSTGSRFGPQAHGGYDCSGFVWRVFKLSGNPAGAAIGGRTAADQAREAPKDARYGLDELEPGDLVFFGPGGDVAGGKRIDHEGIALSTDFMIHASSQGVYVSSLAEDRRVSRFAWARRVL